MYACMYVRMYACMYYVCMYAYMYACMYVFIYLYGLLLAPLFYNVNPSSILPIKYYLQNIVSALIVTIGYPSGFYSSNDMDLIHFKNSL